jgi:molybdate transport system permease protein
MGYIFDFIAMTAIKMKRSRLRHLTVLCFSAMVLLSPAASAADLLVLLGRSGALGVWLDHWGLNPVFTWQGAVIASTLAAFPLVQKAARAAFEEVDPQLEDAARVLGLSPAGVFFRVSLPLAARGISAGALLAFASAPGEFAGNLPGRTQTLSVAIYSAIEAGDNAGANMLVIVASTTCTAVLLLAGRLTRGRPQLRVT